MMNVDMNVNEMNKSGKNAFYVACEMGHKDIVRLLLSVDDIQIQNQSVDISTVATITTYKKDDQVEAKCNGWAQFFTGHITHVNDHEDENRTYNILFEDGERKYGVKPNQIKGNSGIVSVNDPLDIACANGHNEIVKLLLAVDGIDSNRITNGITPLQRTKQRNRADIATILMNAGVDCSLHDAVFWNHLEAVERCLKQEDANVNDKDEGGKTALFIACEMDHTDIIRRLLSVDGIQIQQAKTAAALKRGDQLNVKCDGWTRYYNGQITEINEDGTFAVLFEDGERKGNVSTEQIKGNNSYDPLELRAKREEKTL